MNSDNSLQAQSTGEDSSSDAAMSDTEMDLPPRHAPQPKLEPQDYCGDDGMMGHNGGMMDQQRNPNFPGALLGLQGIMIIQTFLLCYQTCCIIPCNASFHGILVIIFIDC